VQPPGQADLLIFDSHEICDHLAIDDNAEMSRYLPKFIAAAPEEKIAAAA